MTTSRDVPVGDAEAARLAIRAAVVHLDAVALARAVEGARRRAERTGDPMAQQIARHGELWLRWSRGVPIS